MIVLGCQSSPDRLKLTDAALTKSKGVYYYSTEPYSGILEEYDQSQNLMSEISLLDGVKHGKSKFYWPDGTLKRVANYRNGVYHGEVTQYYENGKLFSQFNYSNGQETGTQKIWKSDGRIKVNYEVINGRKYGLTGVKNCVNVLEDSTHNI